MSGATSAIVPNVGGKETTAPTQTRRGVATGRTFWPAARQRVRTCQATLKTVPLATPKTDPRRNGVYWSTTMIRVEPVGGAPRRPNRCGKRACSTGPLRSGCTGMASAPSVSRGRSHHDGGHRHSRPGQRSVRSHAIESAALPAHVPVGLSRASILIDSATRSACHAGRPVPASRRPTRSCAAASAAVRHLGDDGSPMSPRCWGPTTCSCAAAGTTRRRHRQSLGGRGAGGPAGVRQRGELSEPRPAVHRPALPRRRALCGVATEFPAVCSPAGRGSACWSSPACGTSTCLR